MNEILVLVLGAFIGYTTGWLQKYMDQIRKRKSAATALLAEQIRHREWLEYISSRWKGGKSVAEFSMPMHDRIPDLIELFKPETVFLMLDYTGYLMVLRSDLKFLNTIVAKDQRRGLIIEIRKRAIDVLKKGESARNSLVLLGAKEISMAPSELRELAELKEDEKG